MFGLRVGYEYAALTTSSMSTSGTFVTAVPGQPAAPMADDIPTASQ